jgi:hypothetical protein
VDRFGAVTPDEIHYAKTAKSAEIAEKTKQKPICVFFSAVFALSAIFA